METANIVHKLHKINRSVSFNIWHVRIGGLEMALFFLFAVGEIFVRKFIPMELDTQHIVSETMSCISVLILGEAISRSLYKLTPRRRWATLMAMASGAVVGLLVALFRGYDKGSSIIDMSDNLIALGAVLILDIAAFVGWWYSMRRLKRLRFERTLARTSHGR